MQMGQKRFTSEQIIAKLREAEVEVSRGQSVPQACRKIGVTEQTYYRWRKAYGGLRLDQAKRLKELEQKLAAELKLQKEKTKKITGKNIALPADLLTATEVKQLKGILHPDRLQSITGDKLTKAFAIFNRVYP